MARSIAPAWLTIHTAFSGMALMSLAWLPSLLAIAALAVSIVALLKVRALEFAPEVLAGDVILPRASRLGGDIKLLLPMQFTNAGASDGIVEGVALRLTLDGQIDRSILFSPSAAVDMPRFVQ